MADEKLIVKSLKTEKTKIVTVSTGTILRNAEVITADNLQNSLVKPKVVKR